MKKLGLFLIVMLLMASTAWAGSLRPASAFERCMNTAWTATTAEGLVSPWGGGDVDKWNASLMPKYNKCWCSYKGHSLPAMTCS